MPSNASVIVRAEFPVGADVLSSAMTAVTMAGGEVGGMDTVRSTRETITRDVVIHGEDRTVLPIEPQPRQGLQRENSRSVEIPFPDNRARGAPRINQGVRS
jgi:hypothetical protein